VEHNSLKLEYKVGLFIGIGLILMMTSILMLGGDKVLFTRYDYLRARFTDVQGLFPGSVVSLAGIPIGNVKDIEFVPSENKLEITMKINHVYHDRLVEGVVAEVKTQGALGDRYVYLNPGPTGAKELPNDSLVTSNETDFMKMLTSRQDGVARVIDLIEHLDEMVSNINSNGQAGSLVKNASEAALKFKSTLGQLDSLLGDLRGEIPQNRKLSKAVTSLADILEKVDQGKGTLGLLVNDPSVAQSLKAFLGGSPRNRYMKDMIRETIQKSESKP
jgi:phospholipid/cholesterol/gamma-HCH transport system substrate-binding protein